MAKIITLGEIMLRLSPSSNSRLVQCQALDVCYGGSESNVAISLAGFGDDAYYVTKVPDNEIGQSAINEIRRFGVKTDYIVRGGNRLGIYFLEPGAAMRPSKVIYDRAGSAIAEANPNDFDFDKIFEGASWFHWTGITTAISDNAAEVVRQALISAKKHNVTISCDINYRKKLWTTEKATQVLRPLMEYVDVFFGNEEVAKQCLGFKIDESNFEGKTDKEKEKLAFIQMAKEFNFQYIVTTYRDCYNANHNGLSAMLFDGKNFYESNHYDINPIIDRVGGGDAFASGLIHGLINWKDDIKKTLEFAVAASALKHTVSGDYNLVSEDEVLALIGGDKSGAILR